VSLASSAWPRLSFSISLLSLLHLAAGHTLAQHVLIHGFGPFQPFQYDDGSSLVVGSEIPAAHISTALKIFACGSAINRQQVRNNLLARDPPLTTAEQDYQLLDIFLFARATSKKATETPA